MDFRQGRGEGDTLLCTCPQVRRPGPPLRGSGARGQWQCGQQVGVLPWSGNKSTREQIWAPERQLWRRGAPSPLAIERTSASRRSRSSALLRTRQRAAAPSQWAGGRGWLRRKEPLPPLPSRSSPPPPPPRAHLRGSHKGAGRPALGRADKGAAQTLPSTSSWCPVRGCRASERLQTAHFARPGPDRTRCSLHWGNVPHPAPNYTRAYQRLYSPPPHTHIYIHSSISTHGPQHFAHMCAHADTQQPSFACTGPNTYPLRPPALTLCLDTLSVPSSGRTGPRAHRHMCAQAGLLAMCAHTHTHAHSHRV